MGFFKKLVNKDSKSVPKAESSAHSSNVASTPRKPVTPVSYTDQQVDKEDSESPLYPCITDWSTVDTADPKERKKLASQLRNAGNYLNGKSKFEQAVSLYHDAVKCDPKDDSLYVTAARCQIARGNLEEAVKDASDGIRANPRSIECRMVRGQVYESLEKYDDAHYDYTVSVVLAGNDHDNMLEAIERVQQKGVQSKIEQLQVSQEGKLCAMSTMNDFFERLQEKPIPETLLKATEGSGDFYLKSALEAISKRQYSSYEQAFDLLNAAIEHKTTELALALMYRSIFYHFQGKGQDAKKDIEQSVELKPTARAYVFKGEILYGLGEGEAALDVLKLAEINCKDEKSAELSFATGQIGEFTSRMIGSSMFYGEAMRYDPNYVRAEIECALGGAAVFKPSKALTIYDRLLQKYPKDPQVFRYHTQLLVDLEKWKLAIPEADKALSLDKAKYGSVTHVGPLIDKAIALQQTKNGAGAVAALKEALKIDPLYAAAAEKLGQISLLNNDLGSAAEAFIKAAAVEKDDNTRLEYLKTAQVAASQAKLQKEYPDLQKNYYKFWNKLA